MSYTREELEAAGLTDFRVFLRQVWDFLRLPPPTPVQNDIARTLQHAQRRFILQAFRGVGKSWITVAFVLWCLLLDPQMKIMVVSANQNLADDFSKFAKQLIDGMPLLQHLRTRVGQRDSAIKFDVGPALPSKDPSVKSVGLTGQLTGSRADLIVADDIEVPKNSQTQLLREKNAELVKEFDAVLKPGGRIIYLGTPQHEDSLYPKLEERGYITRIWTSEIPRDIGKYNGRLARFVLRRIEAGAKAGDPVDPLRFDREDLLERKASYGLTGYALQFLLDTSPSDAEKHPLKCRDFIVTDVDAELAPVKLVWGSARDQCIEALQCGGLHGDRFFEPFFRSKEMASYTGTVMAIDPSGKGKDETAYAIVRFLHGMLYLVEVGGFTDGFSEATLNTIALRGALHKVNRVVVEENYGGGMYTELLRPYLAKHGGGTVDLEWDGWSRGQKEARICDTLQPVLAQHRFVVDRKVIEADLLVQSDTPKYSFIQQLTRLTRDKGALAHDDRVEAVSMAVSYWTSKMARDKDVALADHKQALLEKALEDFVHNAYFVGKPFPSDNFETWR